MTEAAIFSPNFIKMETPRNNDSILIEYGSHKKKIKRSEITESVLKNLFKIPPKDKVFIQMFDEEVDDHIDIEYEAIEEARQCKRLRLLKEPVSDFETLPNISMLNISKPKTNEAKTTAAGTAESGSSRPTHNSVQEQNVKLMQQEMAKASPVVAGLRKKMKATFAGRRELILQRGTNLRLLLDTYPALRLQAIFEAEMENLFGEKHIPEFKLFKDKFSPVLEDSLRLSKSKHRTWTLKFLEKFSSIDQSDVRHISFLCNVATKLCENPSLILGHEEETSSGPFIKVSSGRKLSLVINGLTVLDVVSPENITFVWATSFAIFDLKPPAGISRTYNFLMTSIFKQPEMKLKPTQASLDITQLFNECKAYIVNIFEEYSIPTN